jgi:predicted DNA-binding transcriptional regulator YafY
MTVRPFPRPRIPRVGRPSGKFTQARRLDLLREQLEAHVAGLTLEELAGMLHVTTRSVRRYLRELAIIKEVESVPVRPGQPHLWRIKPSEFARTVALRRTQAHALLATRRVFDVLRGSALFDEIELALRQLEQVAQRPTARATLRDAPGDKRVEDRFAYVPPPSRVYASRSEDVDEAFHAMAELRVLRCRYREEGADARAMRVTMHPYAMVLHGGAITFIGRDADRGSSRGFALDRMSDLQASQTEHFELPADFDVGEWLHGDFGVGRAARSVRLVVEFDTRAADAVRSRRVHRTQRVAVAPDGRVRASLTVPESPEVLARVRGWVLAFGSAARVVEPLELAESLADELRRAAAKYA